MEESKDAVGPEGVESTDSLFSDSSVKERTEEEDAILGSSGSSLRKSSNRKMPRWLALDELERDRSRVTLNRDRVKTITQKLSKLQQGLEGDKVRERATFEKRLKELEGRCR